MYGLARCAGLMREYELSYDCFSMTRQSLAVWNERGEAYWRAYGASSPVKLRDGGLYGPPLLSCSSRGSDSSKLACWERIVDGAPAYHCSAWRRKPDYGSRAAQSGLCRSGFATKLCPSAQGRGAHFRPVGPLPAESFDYARRAPPYLLCHTEYATETSRPFCTPLKNLEDSYSSSRRNCLESPCPRQRYDSSHRPHSWSR